MAALPPTEPPPASAPTEATVSQPQRENVELVGQVSGIAYAVTVQGHYAYFIDRERLVIVDVSDPVHPTIVGKTGILSAFEWDVAVMGDYAYIVDWGGLRVINVSDPAHPTESGLCNTLQVPNSVTVANKWAYVSEFASSSGGGLRIIDVSDPAHPIETGRYPYGSNADVAVAGNHAYLVGGSTALQIVNIADPAHPAKVGSLWWTPGDAEGVVVAGGYAYVAEAHNPMDGQGGGLRIFNVSDPTRPRPVGYHSSPLSAQTVALADEYALVNLGGDLSIIQVSDPANPTEVGFFATPGYARDIAVAGDYSYVADGDGGLLILRLLQDKVIASIPTGVGGLTSTSGDTIFLFPSAFTATVNLTYRHLWTDQDTGALAGIGRTFELSAVYSNTGQVAQLAPGRSFAAMLHYTDAELGPAIESTLALYAWDGNQWVQEPTSVLDTSANTVSATPNHLGTFAVLGETHRLFLPVVMKRL